jgi:tRNA (guanosine-2'-O-)-methyltransferase
MVATLALAIVACGPTSPAVSPASQVTAQAIEAPEGVAIVSACTPTGPELCFNATDDNCNGILDEGCGVGTGAVQFAIAWGDSPADVDLAVTSPAGERVSEANRTTASGLRFDRDCPTESCMGQNIENVHFEAADPPRGRWIVEIRLNDLHGAESPVRVRFGARVGTRSFGSDVLLSRGEDRKTFAFTLGN